MFLIEGEFELVAEGVDIEGCNGGGGRIQIGSWGDQDFETKLNRCATEVKADSRCGLSFFFRADKGRCFCEEAGAKCTMA